MTKVTTSTLNKTLTTIADAFMHLLYRKGLVDTSQAKVVTTAEVSVLFEKWKQVAASFIYKGLRVVVDMRVMRMCFGESRCVPVIYLA